MCKTERGMWRGIKTRTHLGLEPDSRAAAWAGDVLGVEPAIGGISVFPPALGAEREIKHRRTLAVEGGRCLDAESGPAISTAREREAEPPIERRVEFGETGAARSEVWSDHSQDGRTSFRQLALVDQELPMALKGCLMAADVMDLGRGRGFSPQSIAEYRHDVRRPFGVDDHPLGRVLDPAGDIEQRRQPRHERAEADPLHAAQNAEPRRERNLVNGAHGSSPSRRPRPHAS